MEYLKNEVTGEVCFWHLDKHQSFLQVDTIILGLCNQACTKYPNKKFAYLQNHADDEVDLLPPDKHENFNKLIVSLWMCVARHA